MTDELTKVCPKCGRELPLSEYSKDKSKKDGLQFYCKSCRGEYCKSYYRLHRTECIDTYRKYWDCVIKPSCPRVGGHGAQFELFTCEICGTEFRRRKSQVDYDYEHRGWLPRFCSRECQVESQRKTLKSVYEKEIERIKKETRTK